MDGVIVDKTPDVKEYLCWVTLWGCSTGSWKPGYVRELLSICKGSPPFDQWKPLNTAPVEGGKAKGSMNSGSERPLYNIIGQHSSEKIVKIQMTYGWQACDERVVLAIGILTQ
jgi:hypothetical protein